MKKRMTSLFLALVLCLGLLPATALAADGDTVYVGGVTLSSSTDSPAYATTDDSGNVSTNNATVANYNIKWDGSTLTLRNATIKESVSTDTSTFIAGAAIGVLNQNGAAELTITLEGTNTIKDVSTGIFVLAHSPSTGDATLTITGSGSLDASGSLNGIMVQSNSGDATLTIQSADVTLTSNSGNGVTVQAGSADSSGRHTITLSVEGGSLTASGSTGISFDSASSKTVSATKLTVSNNAIVRANDVGSKISNVDLQIGKGNNSSGGIVFDGNKGTVYGSVELQENLTIGEGESLTLDDGASLNTGDYTLTVDGGTLTGNVTGKVTYKVTGVSLSNDSLTLDVGDEENLTAAITPDNATNKNVTWSSDTPSVASVNNGVVTAVGAGTAQITATAADGSGKSATCTVTVNAAATVHVTGVSLDKTSLELTEDETARLTATVKPDDATNKDVTWSSDNESVATVSNGTVTAMGEGTATITVTTEDGNKTASCTVTVTAPPEPTPPPYIPPTYAVTVPETTGGTVEVSPSRASSGRRVAITTQPAPGYELESLTVLDSRGSEIALTDQGDGKFTFTMPSRKVTVQASFAPVPLPFEDVPPGAWYESAVRYVYTHSIMEGMSATTFVPSKSLTRAEAVQVLYNLEGQPEGSNSTTFPDLVYQWYKPAISWAESTGVVDGYEDGTFRPENAITRQEFAQMLYNYAKYKGYDLNAKGDLSSFPDGDQVQKWALPAMTWANGNALINGHDDGTLEPGGTTTRAQAASILMRFDQNLAE